MAELRKSRSACKGALTRAYGDLCVAIAEEDYDGIISERQRMKTLYLKLRESHADYHETLEDETDILASDDYFCDVQTVYAAQQNAAKTALNDKQPQWQMRPEANNEQSFKALGHLINLPPLELQKFSGEPDEFDEFIATFNEVVGNVIPDPAAKLLRLKSQVTGIASDAIKMCRVDSGEEGYARAIKILHDRFGSPYVVCTSVIERLIRGPSIRSPSEIRTFADELTNAEIVLKNKQMYTEIDTQNNIVKICLRLESSLRYEWRSQVMKHKQSTGVYLKFSDFVNFVQEHADVVNDPIYGNDALEDRSNKCKLKTTISSLPSSIQEVCSNASGLNPNVTSNHNSPLNIQCHLCSKSHKLYTCYKFRSMPIDKRCDYVKTNNLCVLCLSNDHLVSECRSTYVCKINNCGKKHSSSLHVYPDVQLPSLTSSVRSNGNPDVYMPTVPVVIDGTLHTCALLDTGSSTTFCSKRLVDELKIQGAKMSYKLQTLHGSKDRFSEAVDFQVSSKDGTECLYLKNVLVVDDIPVENSSISDLSRYPHLKDLAFSQESQVDVLIGQDNSAALVPLEVRSGPVGTPFATLTKMGWTLNGYASDNIPSRRVTSHLITASVHDVSEHRQDEDKDVAYVQDNTLKMSIEATLSDVTDNLYAAFNIIVILLCLMWLFLSSIISLCTYCSYDFIVVHVSLLEASYASMGGVLHLLFPVECVDPHSVFLSIVSHPMTVLINDT